MAALSRASGVPVPTIKFYLREGLLPPGLRTSPNQSQYDEQHVRRLALIRCLTELGGYSLATVSDMLALADETDRAEGRTGTATGPAPLFALLSRTLTARVAERPAAGVQPRYQLVDTVMRERGWRLTGNEDNRLTAASVLGLMHQLGLDHTAVSMRAFAAAAALTADVEPHVAEPHVAEPHVAAPDTDGADAASTEGRRTAEHAVLAAVLDDALLVALRRIARVSAEGGPAATGPAATAVGDPGLPAPRSADHDRRDRTGPVSAR